MRFLSWLFLVAVVMTGSAGAQTNTPTNTPTSTPTATHTPTVTATPTFTPVPTASTGLASLQLDPSSSAENPLRINNASATPVVWVSSSGAMRGTGVSSLPIQNGAAPAALCTVGEVFLDTDQTVDTNCATTADNSLCLCTAANTWTALENN